MTITDKKGVLERPENFNPLVLELGCGDFKRHSEAIGIDALDYPGVDIVGDIYAVLKEFPNGSVDEIRSYHFIEHIDNGSLLLAELSRIIKVNGVVEFVAPHFSNPYFYSDPTHRTFFWLYTFCYFSVSHPLSRKVPTYQADLHFILEHVELRFKSSRPFIVRLCGEVHNWTPIQFVQLHEGALRRKFLLFVPLL
jgi:hypothetical protein